MFEKDAEEYRDGKAREVYHHIFEENAGSPADFAKRCFQDGAEFGYNKCFEQIRKIVNEDTRLDCIIPELLRLKEIK